jgi:hypothetical protein
MLRSFDRLTIQHERLKRLLHKCQKTVLFISRATAKSHQISIDSGPNQNFRVFATDSKVNRIGVRAFVPPVSILAFFRASVLSSIFRGVNPYLTSDFLVSHVQKEIGRKMEILWYFSIEYDKLSIQEFRTFLEQDKERLRGTLLNRFFLKKRLNLLQKCQKTTRFMYRAAAKVHRFSMDFVPRQEFRVYSTDPAPFWQ